MQLLLGETVLWTLGEIALCIKSKFGMIEW